MESINYLSEIIKKYSFIQEIYLTDNDGSGIASAMKEYKNNLKEETEESVKNKKKVKIALSYTLNSSLEQITKTEKWNTNFITSTFGNTILFQSRINKMIFGHFVCNNLNYNHEILKEIVIDLGKRLNKVENELENAGKEMDK